MATPGDNKLFWQRIDEHSKRISRLELDRELQEKELGQHREEFLRMNEAMQRSNGQLLAKLEDYGAKVDAVISDYQQRKGAAAEKEAGVKRTRFMMGTIVSLLAIIVSIIAINHE